MSRLADEFLARHPELRHEDRASERAIGWAAALTTPLSGYFRFRAQGLERLPPGPNLVVANHSVAAVHEIFLLLRAWRRRFGARPIRGLAHRIAWQGPFRRFPVMQKIGAVFAHPEVARAVLARGQTLIVFPGGDVEALRPFGSRYRIDFAGRHGFVRLAREAGVPIVPLVLCGAHAAYVALPGAERAARLSGADRRLAKALPLTLGGVAAAASLPGILFPPLWPLTGLAMLQAFIPLPTRIEAELLDPIHVGAGEADASIAERVRATMQAAMDRLAARRRTPWG